LLPRDIVASTYPGSDRGNRVGPDRGFCHRAGAASPDQVYADRYRVMVIEGRGKGHRVKEIRQAVGYQVVPPDPNGEQAGHAITRAIQLAGLTPADIDHVNAHATGTTVGDLAEAKAIKQALGKHTPAVYAPKAALGHSVGAVGAVESIQPCWRCRTVSSRRR
jgi:hypothetical protein